MALELVEKPTRGEHSDNVERAHELLDQIVGIVDKNKEYKEPSFNYGSTDQEFAVAHEAKEIGRNLIRRHYHLLADLEPRIDYVFIKNTPYKSGKEILGRAKKVSSLNAWLAMDVKDRENKSLPAPFFLIELPWLIWSRLKLPKRIALIDQMLMYCGYNEKLKPQIKAPDIVEFNAVAQRHGQWSSDIREFLDAVRESEKNPLYASQINKGE